MVRSETLGLCVVLSLLAPLQVSAERCASLPEFGQMLSRGDITSVKQAISCGVDPHAQGDKALFVALLKGHHELASYLEGLGLKPNPDFLRSVWASSWNTAQALDARVRIFRLDARRDPDPARLAEEFAKYADKNPPSPNMLKDVWGNLLVVKITPPDQGGEISICSLGADNKPGGEGYYEDVCNWMPHR